jgi:putative DNA methylase
MPEINDASAYDKMPGIGPHPKDIHQWWARLPLPTARAILFASVVDDPEAHLEKWPTEEAQGAERERLFDILRRMMAKRLHDAPQVYAEAQAEMQKHCGHLPAVFDPFAGGGSIPLEANRMGFDTHAGDLNPVAVLLNKCNLELAPRWADHPPINPEDRSRIGSGEAWLGTAGIAADLRYYGRVIRDCAMKKLGHLYPKIRLPKERGAGEANVIAWMWARTVASPNPAAKGARVPLISTFWLSSKKGSEVWLEPIVNKPASEWHFTIRTGVPEDKAAISKGLKSGRATFQCLLTDDQISNRYISDEAENGRLRYALIATVAEGRGQKIYLPAEFQHEVLANVRTPEDVLTEPAAGTFAGNPVGLPYGFRQFRKYFGHRQLLAMTTLSDLVKDMGEEVRRDALAARLSRAETEAYARTIRTFLALAVDRCADFNNSLCRWSPSNQKVMNLFGRQAIPMIWDFAEANILGDSVGAWNTCNNYVADCVETITGGLKQVGESAQIDAAAGLSGISRMLISTDPPYYDNIGYAALSDFFYVWLRRAIGGDYPDLFGTVLVPKVAELTAAAERFEGDKQKARAHFESGFRKAFSLLRGRMDPRFPLTVYYAFKQDEEREDDDGAIGKTGWETLLEALISSGFQITATWPVRASQKWRMVSMGSNALASYIILACRPRPIDAQQIASTQFRQELKRSLPAALRHLQQGNIAPVDFVQTALGPGMGVYSRYSRILESSGRSMSVRSALGIINQTLSEVLSELEDDFDAESRWALAWFEQSGFAEGEFGAAETLSKAKNTTVSGMAEARIIVSKGGNVRLLKSGDLPKEWDSATDPRLTAWRIVHQLIQALEAGGESAAAALVAKLGAEAEIARELAYRLYTVCERKKRTTEALSYSGLVQSWPEISRLAREAGPMRPAQGDLLA